MEDSTSIRRVFVGVKATEPIIKVCEGLQKGIKKFPVRFVQLENLHLTLLPPWNMENQASVEQTLAWVANKIGAFEVPFIRLNAWPEGKYPRLAWIECVPTQQLVLLKNNLFEAFQVEAPQRQFIPHITIARFKKPKEKFQVSNQAQSFKTIEKSIVISMLVDSIQLFEVPKEGDLYKIISSFQT